MHQPDAGPEPQRAVLLDGSHDGDPSAFTRQVSELVRDRLAEEKCRITKLHLDALTIAPCTGCFTCWLTTPGRCAIRDDEEQVLAGFANARIWAMVTPITFGGYSSVLKRALDRVIPILLPFFVTIGGETRHPQRYPASRRLVMVGTLPRPNPESEAIFRRLVARNALNMGRPETTTLVVTEGTDDAELRRAIRSGLSFGTNRR